jgi:hypothetical protein
MFRTDVIEKEGILLPISIVRLHVFEKIKDTVTHPSKTLRYTSFTDLFLLDLSIDD